MKKISAVLAAWAMAGAALGQVHAGDVILRVSDNRVTTNGAPVGVPLGVERVFSDRLGKLGPSLPNRTPDPGYNSVPNQFVAGQTVGLRVRRAARIWTPSATVPGQGDFCTVPEERIEVLKSSIVVTTPEVDPAGGSGPTIEIGYSDPTDGFLHEHAVYWLTGPVEAGVYLIELEVWVGTPDTVPNQVQPSLPYWIALNQNRPAAELDEAVLWLRARVAASDEPLCPAPACACDWNGVGGLSVQDIFDFLASYFAGAGDFNGAGGTTVQDIFDFLGCYFGGCP